MRRTARTTILALACGVIGSSLLVPAFATSSAVFPDVPSDHWAASYIRGLVELGILRGHADGNFRPQWNITRAEVAKVCLKTADVSIRTGLENPYRDLSATHSLRDALLTAFDRGYLDDHGQYADPDRPASRFETLRCLLFAFGYEGRVEDESSSPAFPDTSGEQTRVANVAKELGIISGNNGRFLPNNPVTRAEVAKMAKKLYLLGHAADDVLPSDPASSAPPSSSMPPSSSSPPASSTPPVSTGGVELGGSASATLPQLFPSDNWWNVDVSSAPVDANSAAFISFIGTSRTVHPDFGGTASGSACAIYGFPYIVVPGSQPKVPVAYVEYGDESDNGAPGSPGFPIPDSAKTSCGWIEGGAAGGGTDGDHHMLLVDRDNRFLYELYHAHWTGTRWEAGSGAVFNLQTNDRRPEGWTSADAAGLAILPGLVRYDEMYGSAEIRHAHRVTVRATNGSVYPASHRAGSTSGALPLGARLRLKASVDPAGISSDAGVQRLVRALQRYGLIVADNGSDLYISGTHDLRWDNDVLNPALGRLRGSDFEVLERGWRP